jgi:hypothetical protein
MTPDEAVAEIAWVARESRALMGVRVDKLPEQSQRWHDYLSRKRKLLAYLNTVAL